MTEEIMTKIIREADEKYSYFLGCFFFSTLIIKVDL